MNWSWPARILWVLVALVGFSSPGLLSAFAQTASRPEMARIRDAAATRSSAFAAWAGRFRNQQPPPAELANGLRLAQERARAMRALLESNPEEFVRRAMPEPERAALPDVLRDTIERRLRLRGFFGVYCHLPSEPTDAESAVGAHGAGMRHEVRANGVTYAAHVYGRWKDQTTVLEADLEGVALDDAIALGDSPTPDEQAGAGSPVIESSPSTSSANTVLYMIARFSDQTSDPLSESTALSRMTVLSNFWINNSYGTVSVRGLIHPDQPADVIFITLPQPASYASTYNNSFGSLLADARSAASALGYNYSDYNLDVVVTTSSGFSYAGRAYVGSQGAHLVANYTSLRTAGHELGHNLGLHHANYWRTDSTAPFGKDSVPGGYCADSLNAEWVEYGHYFSLMSAQSGGELDDATKPHYAAAEKARLGWLSGSRVQYVSASGTYRLYRHDHVEVTNDPRGIRIELPATDYTGYSRRYWLNYRYAPWSTAANWFRNGVQLDVCRTSYGSDGATLLDLSPFSSDAASPFFDPANKPSSWWTLDNSDKKDGALVVGRTYSDLPAGIHITPVATGNNGPDQEYVDVVINLGTFANNSAPVINTFTANTNQVGPGQSVAFSVSATDPEGDPLAYAWSFDETQVWTASGLNSDAANKSWSSTGQYRVLVTVSDMKGGTASDSIIVTVGTPTNKRQILGRVLWAGHSVPEARVYAISGSTTYQAFTESDGSYALTDLPAGNYTLNCRAEALTFTAQFQNPVSVTAGNAYGMDFFANESLPSPGGEDLFTLSGLVSDGTSGVANAEVFADGHLAVTDAAGNYTISNLVNGNYTVIARKDDWSFTPANRVVTINDANSTGNNFTRAGEFSISGRFYNVNAAFNAPAPRVYLSNGQYITATRQGTGANRYWVYTLPNVSGGTYAVSAELSGYNLVSTNYSNPLVVDANLADLDFIGTAAPASAAINGHIEEWDVPLPGVTVQARISGIPVAIGVTDTDGWFRLSQLTNATYVLQPTKAGYAFSPSSRTISAIPSSGNDFVAVGTNTTPVITAMSAEPNPVFGADSTSTLGVSASGNAPLSYAWAVLSAPAPVALGTNDGPGAAITTASFQATGNYLFRVKVTDASGFSTTSNLTVTVNTGAGQMVVRPYEIQVTNGEQVAFAADAWSQQGALQSVTPVWSVSGGGTISTNGIFAASARGGPFHVVAVAGTLSATGSVWVIGDFLPIVSIQAIDVTASETGPDAAVFRITRNGGTNAPLAIRLSVGGSARFPGDYLVIGADAFSELEATVVIPTGDYSADLFLTPEDDSIAEGEETVSLTVLADAAYYVDPLSADTVIIADDDPQALVVSTDFLEIAEGQSAGFEIQLLTQPATDFTVTTTRSAGDTDLTVTDGGALLFTPANWDQPQTVVLAAAEDSDAADGSATLLVESAGLTSQTVVVAEIDNDVQFLVVSTNALTVLEGSTSGLWLSLNARPIGDLLVNVSLIGGTNFALASPPVMTFTANDWNQPQTVTVTVSEDVNLANSQANLTFASAGLTNVVVAVTEIDTSVLALSVSTNDLFIAEGTTNTVTVQLTAEPANGIAVDLLVYGDPHLLLLGDAWLIFTSTDWHVPRVVSFTAAADANAINEQAVLSLVPTELSEVQVTLHAVDDETLELALTTNNLTIVEGETNQVALLLTAQPTNDVIVTTAFQSGDPDLAVVLGGILTFTPTNWDTAQFIVFAAAPDGDAASDSAVFTIAADGFPEVLLTVSELDTNTALPLVTVEVANPASEWGLSPGAFTISRSGDTNLPLTVWYAIAGSAESDVDYVGATGPLVVPAGASNAPVVITPLADSLAEGDETVELTLLPDTAYVLTNASALLTLRDLPVDAWRFSQFSAMELLDSETSGDGADPDQDRIVNLLEYAFGLDPKLADVSSVPFGSIMAERLTLTYRQNKAAVDVTFAPEARNGVSGGPWDGSALSEINRLDLGGVWQVSVQDSIFTTNSAAGFMRLKVTRP